MAEDTSKGLSALKSLASTVAQWVGDRASEKSTKIGVAVAAIFLASYFTPDQLNEWAERLRIASLIVSSGVLTLIKEGGE